MRSVLRLLIAGLACTGLALGCGEPNKGTVPKADTKFSKTDVNAGKGKKPMEDVPPPPVLETKKKGG
jgi:hypothetical protein